MIICVRQCYCHPALIHPYLELRKQQTLFFALQIVGGHIGLPILLIAAILLRKPRPDLTFINFGVTWVSSSIVLSIGLVRFEHLSQLLPTNIQRIMLDYTTGVQQPFHYAMISCFHIYPFGSGVLSPDCTYQRSWGDDWHIHVNLDYPGHFSRLSIEKIVSSIYFHIDLAQF